MRERLAAPLISLSYNPSSAHLRERLAAPLISLSYNPGSAHFWPEKSVRKGSKIGVIFVEIYIEFYLRITLMRWLCVSAM